MSVFSTLLTMEHARATLTRCLVFTREQFLIVRCRCVSGRWSRPQEMTAQFTGACTKNRSHLSRSGTFSVNICSVSTLPDFFCIEQAIIIISIIIAILQAPLNILMDFLFDDIITAPTVDKVKIMKRMSSINSSGVVGRAIRRASNAVRRMSNVVQSGLVAVTRQSSFAATLDYLAPKNDEGKRIVFTSNDFVRDIPDDVLKTHAMVAASDVASYLSAPTTVRRETSMAAVTTSSLGREESAYDLLVKNIKKQRTQFTKDSKAYFDAQWGWNSIDSTFLVPQRRGQSCCRQTSAQLSEEIVKKEIESVKLVADSKYKKLKNAPDIHVCVPQISHSCFYDVCCMVQIGLEVFHIFICDLLGRSTSAAKIFASITDEEFRHTMIVTPTAKILAWIAILFFNLFFVYFVALKVSWK
jgi:hypothetical protein